MPTYKPGQGSDDCWVRLSTIYLSDNELVLGNLAGSVEAGIRFSNVTIPKGYIIESAKVTFREAVGSSGTTCNLRIKGQAVDDAATFSTYADFAARARTAAYVDWNAISAWTKDSDYDSPDISTIIQEIVNRANWASGQSLVLFFADNASDTNAAREPYSYEGTTTYCARLVITLSSPSMSPSASPSASPSKSPSASPSISPSASPSISPSASMSPSASPSLSPSASVSPSMSPSPSPSMSPSPSPSLSPSASISPSASPSLSPSASISPSMSPSPSPSASPSISPSASPSLSPSAEFSTGTFAIPSLQGVGTSKTTSSQGQFIIPVPIMYGTSVTTSHSSGQFVIPMLTSTGRSHSGSYGTFVIPMIVMSDISVGRSRGAFDIPMVAFSGYGRMLPISDVFKGIVMNLLNQAISTYSSYDFNSVARHKGKYLGATDTGIYVLGGSLDNGTRINSKLKTGSMDFGDTFIKYIRDVWITHRTDGHLALVILVDEDAKTAIEKDTQIVSDEIREERLKPPRGLKGRFYTVELRNISGADFDIDTLGMLVESIKRKVR